MRNVLGDIRDALLRPPMERQGAHPDPADPAVLPPPPLQGWEEPLVGSAAMKAFETGLRTPTESDIRAAVLQELSAYWGRDLPETLDRCINWEDYSVEEWREGDRDTPEGLLDFYQHCESWAYDLMWYDYLRTCGYGVPAIVGIAEWLQQHDVTGSHLDFGAGSGSASIMFHHLGWRSTAGDVSMPLLDFARWRAQQRGLPIDGLDLREPLPVGAFDVVTAIDTFAHVPDVFASASSLHAALRPDGYLFVNFDVREVSEYNAWHLYSEANSLHWDIRRAGFRRVDATAGGLIEVFQRVDPSTSSFKRQLMIDRARYSPSSSIFRHPRSSALRVAQRTARRLWGQN